MDDNKNDVRCLIAHAIRTLERDGDEHGVSESLHEAGLLIQRLLDAATAVATHTQSLCVGGEPFGQQLIDVIERVTGGADGR